MKENELAEVQLRLLDLEEALRAEAESVLRELGAGDRRFSGTTFGRGECSFETFLQQCRDREKLETAPAGQMPQIVHWLADARGRILGIIRLRPLLDEKLMRFGGNLGYYICPSARGKGYGTTALRMALIRLRAHGVEKALLTVHPDNPASTRMVLAAGGIADGQSVNEATGNVVNRYWIGL